jgi:hypothetical protein
VAFNSFKRESISKIIERIALDLTLNHFTEKSGEPPGLLFGFTVKQLGHYRGCGLANRTSVTIECDLRDRFTRELKCKRYLVPTERIVQIDLPIRVKEHPLASW